MTKIAIFASGRGSNTEEIIKYFQNSNTVSVSLIISNKQTAPVLDIGKQFDINTLIINRVNFYESEDILKELSKHEIDFIVLAGFMWLIPKYLVQNYEGKIINIHPALLPKYGGKGMYGMSVHKAVYEAKELETGITIHFVNEHYDEGNIIFQVKCTLDATDTPETIAKKIHQLEYQYFSKTIENTILNL
jgi:phosphoribosylglycinamide formyltransferase-1